MKLLVLRFAAGLAALAAVSCAALAQESAQIAKGKEIYAQFCTLCHGADGRRGEGFQVPIWGAGSAIASKFGNAQTMLDYMQVMPFNDPTLIDDVQRLAVTAFVLANHGTLPRNGELTLQGAAGLPIK
jgi:mono/diheme cytochrome c family protein